MRAALAEGLADETEQLITAGVPFNITGTTNILVAPCNERMIYAMDPE